MTECKKEAEFFLTSSSSLKQKEISFLPHFLKRDFTLQNCFSLLLFSLKKIFLKLREKEEGEKNLINKTFLWNFPIFLIFFSRKTIPSLCCPFPAFNFTSELKTPHCVRGLLSRQMRLSCSAANSC